MDGNMIIIPLENSVSLGDEELGTASIQTRILHHWGSMSQAMTHCLVIFLKMNFWNIS